MLWTWDAGDAIESSAAISGDLVFIGAATGELVALNLSDGKKRWTYKTTKPIGESSPAVAGGLVFIGDLGGVVHAVKVADGTAAWTHKTEGEIKSSPVPLGDRVLIGSYDGSLYCLSAKDGKVLWSLKTENYVHGTPAVDDTAAYLAGCDEVFRAVRISDGQPLFTMPIGAYTGASVALQQGQAFFGTFNNEVMALDLQSKKMLWKYAPKDRQFPFYSSAAVADGKVVLGGRDKMVHALDAKTGKPLWTFTTRARVDSSPAIAGGRVFVGSNDGRIYGLDLGQRQESLGIRSRLARDVLSRPSPRARSSSPRPTVRSSASDSQQDGCHTDNLTACRSLEDTWPASIVRLCKDELMKDCRTAWPGGCRGFSAPTSAVLLPAQSVRSGSGRRAALSRRDEGAAPRGRDGMTATRRGPRRGGGSAIRCGCANRRASRGCSRRSRRSRRTCVMRCD